MKPATSISADRQAGADSGNPMQSHRSMSDFAALYPTYASATIAKPC